MRWGAFPAFLVFSCATVCARDSQIGLPPESFKDSPLRMRMAPSLALTSTPTATRLGRLLALRIRLPGATSLPELMPLPQLPLMIGELRPLPLR